QVYAVWESRRDYVFVYEAFMRTPDKKASEVLGLIGIEGVSVRKIVSKVKNLPTDQYEKTLLSPAHITDPKRVRSFKDTLAQADLREIEGQHFDWLLERGYALTQVQPQ